MKTLVLSMISIAATIAAMTACTSESDPINEIDAEVNVPINFGQSINLFTKAIATGDKLTSTTIGIWGIEYSDVASWKATNFMDNLSLTVDNTGGITYTSGTSKYYSIVPETKYDFYAYSPIASESNGLIVNAATAGNAPTIKVTIPTSQTSSITDIMYATPSKNNTKSTTGINLAFQHALAQLKFTIKKEAEGSNASNLTAIKVHANTVGIMNLNDGKFSSTETPGDFSITTSTSITTSPSPIDSPLLVFPEDLGNNSVTFTIDGKEYAFTPTATLTAGKITTINVTISSTGITFTQSLTDWTNETEGSGTI